MLDRRCCRDEFPRRTAFHRDDQPDEIRTAAGGRAPVVVAETDSGHMLLLDPGELDACDGSIDRLITAIEQSADRLGLAWVTS